MNISKIQQMTINDKKNIDCHIKYHTRVAEKKLQKKLLQAFLCLTAIEKSHFAKKWLSFIPNVHDVNDTDYRNIQEYFNFIYENIKEIHFQIFVRELLR
jgi:hypothetical protein